MNSKRLGLLASAFLMVLTVSSCVCISSITKNSVRLGPISERKAPNNDALRYGVIIPFQVGPNMAAVFVNRGVYTKNWNYDFEDGSDLFLFDDVNKLQAVNAIPLNRSGAEPDPDFGGQNRYYIRYPIVGGFVPYGAKIGGQPHPHTGTGFGISQTLTLPVSADGTYSWNDFPINLIQEIFQFTYDGNKFKVVSKVIKTTSNPLQVPDSKWIILYGGMSMAIPDGCDLLLPVSAKIETECAGISRWSRIDGLWKVVSFIPIAYSKAKEHNYYEPTLIRDTDGSLIFAARDDGRQNIEHPSWGTALKQDINAWRSVDGGKSWSRIIHLEQVRSGPMGIGRSSDGTPFVVGNPIIADKPGDSVRDLLYLWPLNGRRNALEGPIVVRDAVKEFGKNNGGEWYVDHPVSTILRLADGKYHAFLAYRVRDSHFSTGIPKTDISKPSAQAGSYLEEVISNGTPFPIWQFE